MHFRTPPQRLHSGSDVPLLPHLPSLLLSTSSCLTPAFLSFLPPLSSPQEAKTPSSQERKQPRNVATQKPRHLGSAGARVSAYNSKSSQIKPKLSPRLSDFPDRKKTLSYALHIQTGRNADAGISWNLDMCMGLGVASSSQVSMQHRHAPSAFCLLLVNVIPAVTIQPTQHHCTSV